MLAPLAVADLHAQSSDAMRVASGQVNVRLDDGRTLAGHHSDVLAAITDLAERRAILDSERTLLFDPLVSPHGGGLLVLHVRLEGSGVEMGVRTTSVGELDDALRQAWQDVHRFADRTQDEALLSELLIPHTAHYCPTLATS